MKLLYLPFVLQGACMVVDEFYFHERRGLPLWERVGHPLDTLTVFICFLYLLVGASNVTIYVALAAFSCLFITKDEFIHTDICTGTEQWLHALLFVLHPLSFLSAYYLWMQGELQFLQIQAAVIFIFMLYQGIRWSFPWRMQIK
jgi:hypothetical protein